MSRKEKRDISGRFYGKGVFPHEMAFTLLIPLRNIFLSPAQLIRRLNLEKSSRVLEVGPGPGYFSVKVAKAIPEGELVLADIQQEMLDYAKKRVDKRKLTNVSYSLCDGHTFPFPDNYFDRIFMVTVIGEVDNQEAYLREFLRILKKGGILSISELAGDPDKLSISEIKALCGDAGFTLDKIHGNKRNYTANFRKD
jgi:ubiquinone/menaquinone biosynthesis C-methylase UbiE